MVTSRLDQIGSWQCFSTKPPYVVKIYDSMYDLAIEFKTYSTFELTGGIHQKFGGFIHRNIEIYLEDKTVSDYAAGSYLCL